MIDSAVLLLLLLVFFVFVSVICCACCFLFAAAVVVVVVAVAVVVVVVVVVGALCCCCCLLWLLFHYYCCQPFLHWTLLVSGVAAVAVNCSFLLPFCGLFVANCGRCWLILVVLLPTVFSVLPVTSQRDSC